MKLNKISRALRINRINVQPKSAIYSSALLTLLASPVFAQDENEAIEVTTPTAQVSEQNPEVKKDEPEMEVIKVTDYLSLSLKALNLLDEPQIMTRGNDTTVSDYSRSGSKYFLGAKVKF
ncbi:hypothetical protein [Shewanella sp. TC10]|uniref:hypothetical protein n=1 Tax=Shewanella sp. TC10 TaxID=1419739 RepID=UPI00129D8F97|nr:hypothetical protein [Shewanella sp. TC10]